MKLPSVEEVLRSSGRTFARFPFVILNAAVGTAAAVLIVDYEGPPVPSVLARVLFAAILGIPLLGALSLTAERRGWGRGAFYPGLSVSIALLVGYAFTVPLQVDRAPDFHVIRLVMLAAAMHFLVAVAPYLGRSREAGFWQYNRTLALRFLTSFIFSGVLYAGLAIALAALDNLFGINVPGRRYGELWMLVAGIFSTWFFFAGIPERLEELDAVTDYPKVVRVFAQYVLLPLMMVYVVILYAYAVKILAEWSWPRGWVSGLILGYGTAGYLMTLLLHPLRGGGEHAWVPRVSKWFFVSLLPLVLMLVLAVLRRVSEYGFTEGRYLALVLGCWMGLAALYFLLSRGKDIRVVPASLGLVAFLATMGPWSAFSVSESSQAGRLRELLAANGMFAEGRAVPPAEQAPLADRRQMSSILAYLHGTHGYDAIQPWVGVSLLEDSTRPGVNYRSPAVVARIIGLEYVAEWMSEGQSTVVYNASRNVVIPVAGYESLLQTQFVNRPGQTGDFPAGGIRYRMSDGLDSVTVTAIPRGTPVDSLTIAILPLAETLLSEYAQMSAHEMDPMKLSIAAERAGMRVRIFFPRISVEKRDGAPRVVSLEMDILSALPPVPPGP